jgi:hypothetical protein
MFDEGSMRNLCPRSRSVSRRDQVDDCDFVYESMNAPVGRLYRIALQIQ